MIGRRALLLSSSLTLAGLAGCTVANVTMPWNPPEPLPIETAAELPAQLARASALARQLLDRADDWALTGRQVASLSWFDTAIDAHARVLLSSDPARRQQVTTPLPSAAPVTQRTAKATYAALTGLLATLQHQHRARALPADGPAALLWASLAAFSATMAARLPSGLAKRSDDDTGLTPDLTATTREQVLELSLQAAYSYELALAAPSLSAADQRRLQERLLGWRTLRQDVLASAPEASASPPPIGYDVRPATDRTGAFALAVQTEKAALPIIGAWLAGTSSAAERSIGVDALASTNTALVGFGGPALRWPGWPS
ncbi:hypothetical protein [Micropruina sp.]|uniref:hypothetical protein n=1 Tax=Micropruina sp. TaxID=2737536 RepID=UPI0039E2F1E2